MNIEELKTNTEITELKDNLVRYIFDPRGFKNCSYLLKGKKNILIDAGCFVDEKVDVLVLTHSHYDHIIFANYIIERNNCEVYASEDAAKHLAELDEVTMAKPNSSIIKLFTGEELKPIKVTKTLKEEDIVDNGRFKLRVIETPGHTPGGISLYEEEKKILFSGDTIFAEGVGRTDLPGSNSKAFLESLNRLQALKVELLCPGHNYVGI